MKRLRWLVPIALLIVVGLVGSLFIPSLAHQPEVYTDIDRGSSTRLIGDQLAAQRVVKFGWQISLARLLQPNRKLQAGEYRFINAASPWQVFDRIARGDVNYYELRIPEGYNLFDTAKAVGEQGIITEADFLKAARNPKLIRDLAPTAPSLEGFLFPSTYRITRSTSAEALCALMVANFRREWTALQPKAPVLETVTLASLVGELQRLGRTTHIPACAAVSLLGSGLRSQLHRLGPALEALGPPRLRLVVQAADQRTITVVIDDALAEPLLRAIHSRLPVPGDDQEPVSGGAPEVQSQ